jgi:hypothetical protein
LDESIERVEILAEELLPGPKAKKAEEFKDLLVELGKTVVY